MRPGAPMVDDRDPRSIRPGGVMRHGRIRVLCPAALPFSAVSLEGVRSSSGQEKEGHQLRATSVPSVKSSINTGLCC